MGLINNNRLNKNLMEGMSLRSTQNGKLWTSPSRAPSAYGGLLAVDAISCYGCDVISSSNGCDGSFEEA